MFVFVLAWLDAYNKFNYKAIIWLKQLLELVRSL